MEPAIRVQNLGKRYRLGRRQDQTLRELVVRIAKTPLKRAAQSREDSLFSALDGVSFEVNDGEVVGIIGKNGAGKSTLLKILSRITEPTAGTVDISGRIASLLEVGTGFHPELTGRENVYLNGAILGMTREEIRKKFDEIVAFAEVEPFIDTAVKHYSSGMYLRLAFAVAAHLDPEILIVDEVLAVGDASFQKKCLGKMAESSHQGRTVLFVSHNLTAINQLCHRVIWMSGGRLVQDGAAFDVVGRYLAAGEVQGAERAWDPESAPGDERVRLLRARVRQGADVTPFVDINQSVEIEMDVLIRRNVKNIVPSFAVVDAQGTMLFRSCDWRPNRLEANLYRFVAPIPPQTLAEGRMSILLQALFFDPFCMCFHEADALTFDAVDSKSPQSVRGPYLGPWPGAVRLRIDWRDPISLSQ